jgi:hypothetical protein
MKRLLRPAFLITTSLGFAWAALAAPRKRNGGPGGPPLRRLASPERPHLDVASGAHRVRGVFLAVFSSKPGGVILPPWPFVLQFPSTPLAHVWQELAEDLVWHNHGLVPFQTIFMMHLEH